MRFVPRDRESPWSSKLYICTLRSSRFHFMDSAVAVILDTFPNEVIFSGDLYFDLDDSIRAIHLQTKFLHFTSSLTHTNPYLWSNGVHVSLKNNLKI